MSAFFSFIFFSTFFLCFSSYFLYPAAIWIAGRLFPLKIEKRDIQPGISIIIAAYNEEKNIGRKIKNTLSQDYPPGKVEILVGSDGSSDHTVQIAGKFEDERVKVIAFEKNRGKTAVQNDLVELARNDTLVFMDAASFLPKNTLKMIVRDFADTRIGCVAGRMQFVGTDSNLTTQSQGLYWRYEVKIRELESSIGNLIGVDGPLYAVRKDNYIPLAPNMISDLITPLLVLEQGKKVVLEPDAIVNEDPTAHTSQEFNTRRRIILRGLVGIFSHRRLLNPLHDPMLAFQIFFHKLLRWFVGPLVCLNLLACLFLSGIWFFKFFLVGYALFFGTAALGFLLEKSGKKIRLFAVPYYFSLVNLAATMAIIDFFRKRQAVSWKPVRN